jgi:hypothetical protein
MVTVNFDGKGGANLLNGWLFALTLRLVKNKSCFPKG